jgi:hypothetical protein
MNEPSKTSATTPGGSRGPQGLGEQAARALEQCAGSSQSFGAVEEETYLRGWCESSGLLIEEQDWISLTLVSQQTAEHEVRYRASDHRAVKRTWPGTFGLVPTLAGLRWEPRPATPRQYLLRQALQNELFGDDIKLEGAMVQSGPSMIIGRTSPGLSLVISQPWLDAADVSRPHPSEFQIAHLLGSRGFSPLFGSLFGWSSAEAGLIVLDAKPDNFVSTTSGILPIDLLLAQYDAAA